MKPFQLSNDQVIIDLSHALSIDLTPYPGDPPFTIRELANVPNEGYRLNLIQGTAHTGTHVDVPAHFIHLGQKVDSFPVEFWFGQAMVVSVVGIPVINFSDLPALDLHQIDFLFFHTGWDVQCEPSTYFEHHPVLHPELATYLSKSGLRGIGMDTPGPDKDPYPVHQIILGSGKVIIENMTRLNELPVGQLFRVMVLPLNIPTEACWVRPLAFLQRGSQSG